MDMIVKSESLVSIANAIREKGDTSEQLVFPAGFVSAIEGIRGGADLNFEVVGNPKPSDPKENTIWVDTDVEITRWDFGAEEPASPDPGMVWFYTALSSTVGFNALKENSIQVYPRYASQYINGTWERVPAKIYQDGEWVNWQRNIIENGNLKEELSGRLRSGSSFYVTQQSGHVRIYSTSSMSGGVALPNKIDVTSYNKLTLYGNVTAVGTGDHIGSGPVLSSALNASGYTASINNIIVSKMTKTTGVQRLECDLYGYSGEYYVGIYMDCGDSGEPEIEVYDFYLS